MSHLPYVLNVGLDSAKLTYRWFHIFYEQLTAWSGLLYVQALVRWRDIELAVENLYSTCPSIIRDASTHGKICELWLEYTWSNKYSDNHKSVFQPSSQETIPALEFVLGSQGSVKTLFSLRDDETSTIMELLDEVNIVTIDTPSCSFKT